MTPRVELIYAADCPNVADARKALREAFDRAGLGPSWVEWDRASLRNARPARHEAADNCPDCNAPSHTTPRTVVDHIGQGRLE